MAFRCKAETVDEINFVKAFSTKRNDGTPPRETYVVAGAHGIEHAKWTEHQSDI